jgi:hypothetical protein
VTRIRNAAPVAVLTFVLILVLAASALRVGFLPEDTAALWAGAITAGDGEVSIGRVVSAYPSIPYLATTAMEIVTPAGTPTPALLAALILSFIAGARLSRQWSRNSGGGRGDDIDCAPSGALARGIGRTRRHVFRRLPVSVCEGTL